ncbi:MAG TPA: polysaccharide biosynthesis/export family protein [Kofleriaceae bacterium]|jgi:polysaccharide export outer membrane protein
MNLVARGGNLTQAEPIAHRGPSMRQILLVLATLAVLGLLSSCHDDPPVIYPTTAPLDVNKLALGPGDKLNLTVFYGSHSIQAAYALDNTGQISVQFIGSVDAGGKTAEQVRDEIRKRLADGYLNDPIVSLTITEINSLTLSISGMVAKTGAVKFTPGITITEVIARSGGFTPMARKNMVRVTRVLNGVKETYKLPVEKMAEGERPNFPMLPGDEVFVPERPW